MSFITKTNGKGEGYTTNDMIYTPDHIAKMIIDLLPIKPDDRVYDPFFGQGAFYNQFPECIKFWSEIQKGKDFFDFDEHVDWIVSNPPYSIFDDVMRHSYELADNIVYLIPLNKITSSMKRLRELKKYGGIYKLWILPASKCGFPFGFPACVLWLKKDYKGAFNPVLWGVK